MVTLSRLSVSAAAADKFKTRQQEGEKKVQFLSGLSIFGWSFPTRDLADDTYSTRFLREAGEREETSYIHSIACHEQEKRSLRLSGVKIISRAKSEWRRDHQGNPTWTKVEGEDAFIFSKGFSCCCSLFSGKSFGSWMLHGSSFPTQHLLHFSGCFSRLLLSTDWDLDLIGCVLYLQREGSALEEQWKPFHRLWSWLPEKSDCMCINVL